MLLFRAHIRPLVAELVRARATPASSAPTSSRMMYCS